MNKAAIDAWHLNFGITRSLGIFFGWFPPSLNYMAHLEPELLRFPLR